MRLLALLCLLLAGCAGAPASRSVYRLYVDGDRLATASVALHPNARVGQFCVYRTWSGDQPPRYQSVSVIGRVVDLLVVEHDEGDGLILTYLVHPSMAGIKPRAHPPNVVRAWVYRRPDAPREIRVEDRAALTRREKKQASVFDSNLTVQRTRPFEALRVAGRGWKGELTTVTMNDEVRVRTWRARPGWFSGILEQSVLGEYFRLSAFGDHGTAAFPLGILLREAGWTTDESRAAPRWKHHTAEALTPTGERVRYYWPDAASEPSRLRPE